MNLQHPFNKTMIKTLIIILVLQGFPLFELSKTYRWDIQNYNELFHTMSQLIFPKAAQAEMSCDHQCFQKNINHIISKQSSDGHWSLNKTLKISDMKITSEIISLLKECPANTKSAYLKAMDWIAKQYSFDTDFLAYKINALTTTDQSVKPFMTILAQAQNLNGGWGRSKRSISDVYHTSLALIALNNGHHPNKIVSDNAIKYLLERQNNEGSFGLFSGSKGTILETALAIIAIKTNSQSSAETRRMSSILNDACKWLLQKQNTEGAWIQKYAPYDLTFISVKALHICNYPFDINKTCSYMNRVCMNDSKSNIYTSTMALRSLKYLECIIHQNTVKHEKTADTSISFQESSTQITTTLSQSDAITINQLPVANAGSYSPVVKNQPLGSSIFLDGSSSYDPDGDLISYHWYGPFESVSGIAPLVLIPEGRYTVSLIVNDDTACSTVDTKTVEVFPEFSLSIDIKDKYVALSWDYEKTDMHYGIFRSNEKYPSRFSKIGETTSADMTYIDTEQLENDTTYLYAVSASDDNNFVFSEVASIHTTQVSHANPPGNSQKSCDTGKACFISTVTPAMADSSINENSPPVIWSIPVTLANVDIVYNYDVNATDPDDDQLTYHLFKYPDGMTIDSTTGHITWIPQSETPEVVTVQVKDTGGAIDTQTFTIMSLDAVNYVNVPNIVGLSKHEAEDTIYSKGLVPGKITYQHTANILTNTVVDQFPQESSSVLSGATVDMVLSKTEMKKIPNVIGLIQSEAEKIIVENLLTVGKISEVSSDTIPEGYVVIQSPAAGNMAAIGFPVDLGISSGKSKLSVPNVVGIHYSQAVPTIVMAKLLVGKVTEESSNSIQAGIIMNQNPKSGTMVELETEVDLVVCSGLPKVIVPNLLNKQKEVAIQMITDTNLTVGRIGHQYNEYIPKDCVIKQDPTQGTAVIQSSAVNFVISQGPRPKVIVPDVEGLHQNKAEEILTNASLFVGQISFQLDDTIPASHVISQFPKAGESLVVGSAVDLVISQSHPPIIISTPPQHAYVGENYIYPIVASDPENDPLHYSLQEAPKSMAIDSNNGSITWIPESEGIFSVSLQVSDEKGGVAEQSYTILVETVTIDDDFIPPHIQLTVLRPVVLVGDTVGIVVSATDNIGVQVLGLSVNGENLFIDESGKGYYSSNKPGVYKAIAKAIDLAGNEASAQAEFRFIIEGQHGYPDVEILAPAYGTQISTPTEIIGTVSDDNLLHYTLAYSPKGKEEFIVINTGLASVENGVVGYLDPTMMKNGFYTVRLSGENTGGKLVYYDMVYEISGNMKVGNFSLGFTDLMIPVSGIPITISRNYDSRDKTKGDFGVGWTLGLKNIEISESETMGKNWGKQYYGFWGLLFSIIPATPHTISVNFPDGRKLQFYMDLSPNEWSTLFPITINTTAIFKPLKGTFSTLESLDNNNVQVYCATGIFDLSTEGNQIYDPMRFKLTDVDGSIYIFHKKNGLEHIQDAAGNTIDIGHDGIIHSSGKSVKFIRDAEDRIISIVDPMGNNLIYNYDGYGNLIRFTDQEGNTTRFTYNNAHGLVDIIDSRGIKVARTIYDDNGRVIAHIDADGNRIEYEHDVQGRQEVIKDQLGRITVYEYDEDGNVVNVIDPNGKSTRYTYDSKGNKLSETDPLGHTKKFLYDDQNNLIEETDQLGNTTVRSYNEMNLKTKSIDPLGREITYEYNKMGRLTKKIIATGSVLTNNYDEKGNLISTSGCCGKMKTYEYDEFGNRTKETDALGNIKQFTYDKNGNVLTLTETRKTDSGLIHITKRNEYNKRNQLTKTIDANGNIKTIEYNQMGMKTAEIDHSGNRTEYEYDLKGKRTKTIYADGKAMLEGYDIAGNRTSLTDRSGQATRYEYDSLNRVKRIISPDGNIKELEYDDNGKIIGSIDEIGTKIANQYDASGRVTVTTDPFGNTNRYSYDEKGNQISWTDANGNIQKFEYDALDRQTKKIFPDGTFTSIEYDPAVYDKRKISETDQAGNTTQYAYDPNGNLIEVTDASGNKSVYTYDESGNKLSQTDPNAHTTSFAYNKSGKLIKRTLPSGKTETFEYDVNGNIIKRTDFNGNTISYTYGKMNELLKKKYPDGAEIIFSYKDNGKRETITDSRGITTYEYNKMGGLIKEKLPDGTEISYTYDSTGNRTSITIPSGTTYYSYDELNRLKEVKDPQGETTYYTYDKVGNRKSVTYPNKTITIYTYDNLNRLIYLENRKNEVGDIISSYEYTLDKAGNRIKVIEHTGRVVNYSYDNLHRLTKEEIIDSAKGNRTIAYTYDNFGNRLTKNDSNGITYYSYNSSDQLIKETTPQGVITYQYDNNGNLIQKSDGTIVTQYKYDYENKLTVMKNGSNQTTYKYDVDGNRISSTTNGDITYYLVDKNRQFAQVIEERNSQGSIVVSYIYGDDLISQRRIETKNYYHYDGQMSTRQLTNSVGMVTDEYVYDAFGNLVSNTGDTINNYLFSGEQYDPNLKFYYFRARYYDQKSGRFTCHDPMWGKDTDPLTLHRYLYAKANPVMFRDQNGMMASYISSHKVSAALRRMLYAIVGATIFITGFSIIQKLNYSDSIEWEGNISLFLPPLGLIPPWPTITIGYATMHKKCMVNDSSSIESTYILFLIGLTMAIGTLEGNLSLKTPKEYGYDPSVLAGLCGLFYQSMIAYGGEHHGYFFMGYGVGYPLWEMKYGIDLDIFLLGGFSLLTPDSFNSKIDC
jgi:RHS repeat-associated protein